MPFKFAGRQSQALHGVWDCVAGVIAGDQQPRNSCGIDDLDRRRIAG
jgi:hypothetical protein